MHPLEVKTHFVLLISDHRGLVYTVGSPWFGFHFTLVDCKYKLKLIAYFKLIDRTLLGSTDEKQVTVICMKVDLC